MKTQALSFLATHKKIIVEVAFNLGCIIVGFIIATRYLGDSFDIKGEMDKIKTINAQITANNDACVKAVESNKKLKAEYDTRIEKITKIVSKNVGPDKKETSISEDNVPASVPSK